MRPFGKNVLVPVLYLVLASPSLLFGTPPAGAERQVTRRTAPPPAPAARGLSPAPRSETPVTLPLTQDWSNTGLISTSDDWSSVPGIVGYLGDWDPAGSVTNTDPRTVLVPMTAVDVNANRSDPDAYNTGGVAEFDGIANPVVAFQGSGTADAPNLVFFLNTSGYVGIRVQYNLRDVDAGAVDAVQQVALQYRVGNTGNFTNVAAGYVADATTGPGLATLVTPVDVTLPAACDNQPEVQVRVITTNAGGTDEFVGVDDINVTGTPAGDNILTISDATVTEGDSGPVTATFTVSLVQPAAAAGVTFDIATADGTGVTGAVAGTDYVANGVTGAAITEGNTTYTFDVTVNGDTAAEATERFTVNVTNVVGATISDGQATGTITNDDAFKVGEVQGAGSESPYEGTQVITGGVVTGVSGTGFFIQDDGDGDPATSDGVLVYLNGVPTVSVGNVVQVTAYVSEYVPSQDTGSPPLTELTSPAVVVTGTGPLPSPVEITTSLLTPGGGTEQLERYEGMRVSVPSLTVVAPTRSTVDNISGATNSQGIFYGVLPGVARPFREPGVPAPDVPPTVNGPAWDNNPERIRVLSSTLIGTTPIDVGSGQVVTGLVGPLSYGFRSYEVNVDPPAVTPAPVVSGTLAATPVPPATADELTVATYNLLRFFDNRDDVTASTFENILQPTRYANRLAKASLIIRNVLRMPDVVALQEIETVYAADPARVAADIAAKVNADAGATVYAAAALVGNGSDPSGLNVAYLYKPAPRLTGVTLEQAPGSFDVKLSGYPTLNVFDHPPLVLRATVNHPTNGQSWPVTIVNNHAKSIGDVDTDPFDQAKRKEQAEWLAAYLDSIQDAENVVSVGDMNAYEFNDGWVDVMGTVIGSPVPADQVFVPTADLVDPNLVLLTTSAAPSRYSYSFDGNAHYFDHVAVDSGVAPYVTRIAHGHANADFPPNLFYNDANSPLRLSDHDPVVAYFLPPDFGPWTVPTTGFYTVAPCRLFDTRDALGPFAGQPFAAGESRTFAAGGKCGVPVGAKAIAVNVTVAQPTGGGFLTLYPEGRSLPLTSTINFVSGQTRANNARLSLGLSGGFVIYAGLGSGEAHVIADVVGYFD